MRAPADVEAYIVGFPRPVQARLRALRRTLRAAVPDAEEVISYGMPAYRAHGRALLCFAAFRDHCSLFPGHVGRLPPRFAARVRRHATSKGTLAFPHDAPLPLPFVAAVAKHRAKENAAMAAAKAAQGTKKPVPKRRPKAANVRVKRSRAAART